MNSNDKVLKLFTFKSNFLNWYLLLCSIEHFNKIFSRKKQKKNKKSKTFVEVSHLRFTWQYKNKHSIIFFPMIFSGKWQDRDVFREK